MIIQPRNPSSQSGIVLVLMTIGMLVLLGMAGLALDMGHTYLMKTRLQNALDAAALSGAKTLDDTGDTVLAEIDARNTFTLNAGDDMNDTGLTPVVEFSDILFDPAQILDPKYVRVSLADYQQPMWFAQLLPLVGDNKLVGASAVAAPSPVLGEICDIMPVMVCGDPAGDDDCSDGDCFGYSYDPDAQDEIVLKTGTGRQGWEVGPGNYQLVRLDGSSGGSDVRDNLAGSYSHCISTTEDIETEPGNTVGPVAQGINTRFGDYAGPIKKDQEKYKADLVYSSHSPDFYYSEYVSRYAGMIYDPLVNGIAGEANRRIAVVLLGNCSTTTNGQGTVPLLGVACFFLTRPAEQSGAQRIYGQIIPGCDAEGTPGPDPGAGPGPYIIQLYKDPESSDA